MSKLGIAARRCVAAVAIASVCLPQPCLAQVTLDNTALSEGDNEIGGGKATWLNSVLDMYGVTGDTLSTDEDLSVNFWGGNSLDKFTITDDANVTVNFEGDNEVEDIEAYDHSNVTVNMNEHNEFEDLEAKDNASLEVRVDGETSCESIKGYDDAQINVHGVNCPRKDVIEVGEDESSECVGTEKGDLTVKDVTLVMHSKEAEVSSKEGNVRIECTKIEGGEGNERVDAYAGGTMFVGGSVVDIAGSVHSNGELTLRRSDVDVTKAKGDESPYRVWSKTGIELIEERNGTVKKGSADGSEVYYVDTDDDDAVHLDASLQPCYYRTCDDDKDSKSESVAQSTVDTSCAVRAARKIESVLPVTADTSSYAGMIPAAVLGVTAIVAGVWRRRRSLS
ncbi:MAG: hypothetical protein Q4A01_05770 [Coriobacteriales bacterium]|nr:hypothetical protein [Coriobacteriales bacterium]